MANSYDDDDELGSLGSILSPIMTSGADADAVLASGNAQAYLGAQQAGVPYPSTTQSAPATTSMLAANSPAEQPPSPSGTSAGQKPSSATMQSAGDTTPAQSMFSGFSQNLVQGGSQYPATNALNPPSEKSTGNAVPASVTPTGNAQSISPLASFPTITNSADVLARGAAPSTSDATGAAQVPTAGTPGTDMNALTKQQSSFMLPASATNPGGVPNPMSPEYRPTKWQRVGRGVLGAVEGLAEHGIRGSVLGAVDPAAVGATAYGAPNRAFSTAARLNAQKQAATQQQLTQTATNAETALKQARTQGAQLVEVTPEIAQDLGNPSLSGEKLTQKGFQSLLTNANTVKGKTTDTGMVVAGKEAVQSQKDAAMNDLRDAQAEEANAKADLTRAGNDPNSPAYKLALMRANTASANASAAQIRANAYALNANAGNLGVDNQGRQIAGSATTAEGTPIGSRFAAPYIKQEGKTAQFNDVLGATDNIELTAQRLVQKGGKLNSPGVAAAIADPKSTSVQWAQGQFATSGLTPEERDYVTNVKAYKENLQALRQSAGGGVSDAQVNRLMEMAPGASTPDLDYLKRQTSQIRQTANRLAEGLPQMKGGHAVRGGSTPSAAPQRPAGVPPNAQYITNPSTGKKGWAW